MNTKSFAIKNDRQNKISVVYNVENLNVFLIQLPNSKEIYCIITVL